MYKSIIYYKSAFHIFWQYFTYRVFAVSLPFSLKVSSCKVGRVSGGSWAPPLMLNSFSQQFLFLCIYFCCSTRVSSYLPSSIRLPCKRLAGRKHSSLFCCQWWRRATFSFKNPFIPIKWLTWNFVWADNHEKHFLIQTSLFPPKFILGQWLSQNSKSNLIFPAKIQLGPITRTKISNPNLVFPAKIPFGPMTRSKCVK